MTTQEELDLFYQKSDRTLKGKEADQVREISNSDSEENKFVKNGSQNQEFDFNKVQNPPSLYSASQYIGNISRNYRVSIEELTTIKGIGTALAKRLCDGGFCSIDTIVNASIVSLSTITGISLSKAETIQNNAKDAMKSHGRVINLSTFSESSKEVPLKEDTTSNTTNKALSLAEDIPNFTNDETIDNELEEEAEVFSPTEPSRVENVDNYEGDIPIKQDEIFSIEEKFDLDDKPSIENSENLTDSEHKELIYESKEIFNRCGYQIIENILGFDNNVNLLYFKSIRVHANLTLVLIVPIKIADFKGSLKVSENSFKYDYYNQQTKVNESHINAVLYSYMDQLINRSKEILSSLEHENQAFNFFKKVLDQNISIKRTLLNNKLFYHSGSVQYKFLIEPVLINSNRVVFLEKIIPFAYQRHSNIHVIEPSKLKDLLMYLEKKYSLVEHHKEKVDYIEKYFSMAKKTVSYITSTSIPFFIAECILVFAFFYRFISFFNFLVIGSCLLGVNLILTLFLSFKDLKKNRELNRNFSIPYYQTLYSLDESSVTLINEDMDPKLMLQFAYECYGENLNYPVLFHIEKEHAKNILSEQRSENSLSEKIQFDHKDNSGKLERDLDLFEEFKDFVEDDPE